MSAIKETEMLIQPKDKVELTEEQAQIWRQVLLNESKSKNTPRR